MKYYRYCLVFQKNVTNQAKSNLTSHPKRALSILPIRHFMLNKTNQFIIFYLRTVFHDIITAFPHQFRFFYHQLFPSSHYCYFWLCQNEDLDKIIHKSQSWFSSLNSSAWFMMMMYVYIHFFEPTCTPIVFPFHTIKIFVFLILSNFIFFDSFVGWIKCKFIANFERPLTFSWTVKNE